MARKKPGRRPRATPPLASLAHTKPRARARRPALYPLADRVVGKDEVLIMVAAGDSVAVRTVKRGSLERPDALALRIAEIEVAVQELMVADPQLARAGSS